MLTDYSKHENYKQLCGSVYKNNHIQPPQNYEYIKSANRLSTGFSAKIYKNNNEISTNLLTI